jgi:hypothetical protein
MRRADAVSIPEPTGAPSNLGEVLRFMVDAFAFIGDATPIEIGAQYIPHFGAGSAPRVLFVPEKKGKIEPPIEAGNAASMVHSCDVAVRFAEDGSDAGRFDGTYRLADRVIDGIDRACAGRVEWGDLRDNSPLNVDGLGADLVFSFTYRRDIRHGAIWALPADLTTPAPAFNPLAPNAEPAVDVTIAPTATVETA